MTLLGDVFAMVMFFSSALAYAIYHGYVFFWTRSWWFDVRLSKYLGKQMYIVYYSQGG
jgi:hypothetical protein